MKDNNHFKIRYLVLAYKDLIDRADILKKEVGKIKDEIKKLNLFLDDGLFSFYVRDLDAFCIDIRKKYRLLKMLDVGNKGIESKIIRYQYKYRCDIGRFSSLVTSFDWQSISYECSKYPNVLYSSELGYKGKLGYKRVIYPAVELYEKRYLKDIFSTSKKKNNLYCSLTSSGQGAYGVAEALITKFYLDEGDGIAYIKEAYYETRFGIDRLKGFRSYCFEDISAKNIAREIIDKKIRFLTVEPIYNAPVIKILDIKKLLSLLSKYRPDKEIYIVVDNSMLGGCFNPFDLNLNPNVNIILVESLIKYRQMGLDLVNAGVLILDKKHQKKVITLRAALGCILQDIGLAKLPLIRNDLFKIRMKIISENAYYMAKKLQFFLEHDRRDLAVCGVSYPGLLDRNVYKEKKMYPYYGSVFTLIRRKECLINCVQYYKFISNVIKIAKSKDISINHGTSFGFESARISLADTDGGTYANPYIRISAGTENKDELNKLICVIEEGIIKSFSV